MEIKLSKSEGAEALKTARKAGMSRAEAYQKIAGLLNMLGNPTDLHSFSKAFKPEEHLRFNFAPLRKLTATIITLNEERNIGRCIDSLQGIVDEIVVVDSASSDRTVEIAEGKGAKVFQHEWAGYSVKRTGQMIRPPNNLILSLDADEELSEELRQSIKQALQGQAANFQFARKANYCGQWINHTGWYPDTKFRIFDRTKNEVGGNDT